MLRISPILAGAIAFVGWVNAAQAQVIVGPQAFGFGPNVGRTGQHVNFHRQLALRELQRQRLHDLAHRRGIGPRDHDRLHRFLDRDRFLDELAHDDFHHRHGSVVVPVVPVVPIAPDPFAGSPRGGNQWYWLSQQAAQGRIPWSTVNRRMYPPRR